MRLIAIILSFKIYFWEGYHIVIRMKWISISIKRIPITVLAFAYIVLTNFMLQLWIHNNCINCLFKYSYFWLIIFHKYFYSHQHFFQTLHFWRLFNATSANEFYYRKLKKKRGLLCILRQEAFFTSMIEISYFRYIWEQ